MKLSQILAAAGLDGSEKLLGLQGGDNRMISSAQLVNLALAAALAASPMVDLTAHGVDTSGATAGQRAKIEALVASTLTERPRHNGRPLNGFGEVAVDEPINLRHVNAELGAVKFKAVAGFAGTMLKLGRLNPTEDSGAQLSVPHRQRLWAVAGNEAASGMTGINASATCFEIEEDQSPGALYDLVGSHANVGLSIQGNVEKKTIFFKGSHLKTVIRNRVTDAGGGSTNSADTCEVNIIVSNYERLWDGAFVKGGRSDGGDLGNDTSFLLTGLVEGYRGVPGSVGHVVTEGTGKAIIFDLIIRGYDGQAGTQAQRDAKNSFYCFNQPSGANDYADWIAFGARSRHITMHGCTLRAESVQRMLGTFRLRDSYDDYSSISSGSSANGLGPLVPREPVFIGRIIHAGEFHLDLTAISNTKGVQYGDDTWYSTDATFGTSAVSYGYFKPFAANFPVDATALDFTRAERCTFPFSQVHGNVIVRAGIKDCTIHLPAEWARLYRATLIPGAVATIAIGEGLTWGEARNMTWLPQVGGEQVLIVKGIVDKGGATATYARGRWSLSAPHIATPIGLAAQASDFNRDFRTAGLPCGNSADGKQYVAQPDGSMKTDGGTTIAVGPMAQTTALFTRIGAPASTERQKIVDRLLYRLADIGVFDANAGILTYLLGLGETSAASRRSLFNAASGVSYDATITGGAPAWTDTQGFAMNADNGDVIATGYDMTTVAEGGGLNDFLMLVGARRPTPGYIGTSDVQDLASTNGRAKLRVKNGAHQTSVGSVTTTTQTVAPLMPTLVMGGRVDNGYQFLVEGGRVSSVAAVSSTATNGGMPDAISLGGGRELWCAGFFKASHFFTSAGGVISPIGDRPLQLHRAFIEAYASIEALP